MHLDVLDLRNFYYRTALGRVAQRAIRERVVEIWPPMAGQTMVGFGFAVPLLRPYLEHSRRTLVFIRQIAEVVSPSAGSGCQPAHATRNRTALHRLPYR